MKHSSNHPMYTCLASIILASLYAASPAAASPYHTTGLDAADRPEIKILSEYESAGDDWSLEGPAIDATLPIVPGLETSVTFGKGWLKEDGLPSESGWLDTEIALKWEVIRVPEEGGFGLTTEPALFAPTGTHGIGSNEWQLEIPVILGWEQGRTSLRTFVAYATSLESHEDELGFGAVAEYDVTESLSLGVEVSGDVPLAYETGYALEGDVGFTWDMGNDLELQGRISHSLHTEDGISVIGAALFLEKAF
ncbi:transporter [Kordiimonas pumila]|uniref:Transporter n=1 Tax=Kordiimonas pumila TaxID=2161677 RepID=A0ABV7D379_9PROT|nr:transporter [Kordiimonas pumila]